MENMDIQIFNNPAFGEVRIIKGENNTPWFVGKDVASILGYAKPQNALAAHVDEEDKTTALIQGTDSNYKTQALIINESGLYSLILSSKLPQAKQFKHWVTSEVLPSIRKEGGYIASKPDDTPEVVMARAILLAKSTIDKLESKNKVLEKMNDELNSTIKSMETKVNYLDQILACKSTVKATIIAQDYGMSAKAFNSLLHEYHIQYKLGKSWVLYSNYLPEGYVKDVPFEITRSNGRKDVANNTQWTQKGRMFLYNFLKDKGVLPLIEQNHV